MRYLRLARSQAILACFAAASLLLIAFPQFDINVSRLFFDHGFYLQQRWWTALAHESLGYFLGICLAVVVGLYAWNKLAKRNLCGVDGKRVVYLFLVLIVGAGLIVNVVLKDNLGRARPRDIAEFGGAQIYTPPFVASHACQKNCSFSSGESAGGFFAIAVAWALGRRRALVVAGVVVGAFVSFCRVATGAHFFSDTVVSFFVMLLVADIFYYYLLSAQRERPVAREAGIVADVQPATTVER